VFADEDELDAVSGLQDQGGVGADGEQGGADVEDVRTVLL